MAATFLSVQSNLGLFSAKEYGAKADGTTDDTTAVQAAIDAARDAGGGTIYFPPGVYKIAGPAQDVGGANAQLLLPSRALDTQGHIPITFRGPCVPPMDGWAYSQPPSGGAIIKSTLTGAGKSILGGYNAFTFGPTHLTAVHCGIENLTFRTPTNPSISAINLGNVSVASLRNVLVDTGTYGSQYSSYTQPTTVGSTGIILPKINNGASVDVDNVMVVEFYDGIQASEHFCCKSARTFGCNNALRIMNSNHLIHLNYFASFFNNNGIVIDPSVSINLGLKIDSFAIERHDVGLWDSNGNDFVDAANKAYGFGTYRVVKSAVGPSNDFRKSGGTHFTFTDVGGGV